MSDIKQVILFRKDLKMRTGKVAAQVAHASMKVFFDRKVVFQGPEGQVLPISGLQFRAPVGPNTGSLRSDSRDAGVGRGQVHEDRSLGCR